MIILIPVIAFLAGIAMGATILWSLLSARIKHPEHIDYKQRWEDAVGLLGAQGQLTKEQVDRITVPQEVREQSLPPVHQQLPLPPNMPSAATQRQLHSMATWDRAAIEIERARNGLPPVDDLTGMASWDKKAVLIARAKAGTG